MELMECPAPCTVLTLLAAVLVAPGMVQVVDGRQSGRAKTKLIPKFYDIRHCDNKPETGMRMFNMTTHLDHEGTEYVDGEVEMTKPMKVIKTLTMIIHRCTGGMAPNQCEYFNRFNWGAGICALVSSKGMPWSPCIASMTPVFKCPVAPGRSHIRNATIDLNAVDTWLSAEKWEKHIWPFEFQLYNEEDKLRYCVQGTVEYKRVLIKKNTS